MFRHCGKRHCRWLKDGDGYFMQLGKSPDGSILTDSSEIWTKGMKIKTKFFTQCPIS